MSVTLRVSPVVLSGEQVRLEPMSLEHAHGLYNRGRNAADWQYLPRSCFVDLSDTRQWVEEALAGAAEGGIGGELGVIQVDDG